MPGISTPRIHAEQANRTIGTLFRNEEWWRDQYYDIYNRGYALRPRYHPMWEPSWMASGKDFFAVEDGQPSIVSTPPLSALTILMDGTTQFRATMDATRRRDGKHVMRKKIFPDEGPHELTITQLFSSRELARDPRNHCVPLLDIIEIPQSGQKLMVMPFLRPFNNPHFQTFGEFVAFFTQISEVRSSTCHHESILIELWIRVSNSCTSKALHTGARFFLQMGRTFRDGTFPGTAQ